MRNLITTSFSSPITSPIQTRTLILPKPISQTETTFVELKKLNQQNHRIRRRSSQTNRYDKYSRTYFDNNQTKQQAHCTPIIELKPIMNGSTQNNETKKTDPPLTNSARVIRFSIAKTALQQQTSSSPSPAIRLVSSSKTDSDKNSSHSILSVNKNEAVPLVPKQINIIKPLSTTTIPAIKLSNPVLISNRSQQPSTK
jgi:hypothetical protein